MIPLQAYRAPVTPAARLVLCRLWDFAQPTTVPGVWWGRIYLAQIESDLRLKPGSVRRCLRELGGTPWLLSFAEVDNTGLQHFELYTGIEGCHNG